jgi:hypothetical protein
MRQENKGTVTLLVELGMKARQFGLEAAHRI